MRADGFKLRCRVRNKPYDIFGAWFDNDHILPGNLKWHDFSSISELWLSNVRIGFYASGEDWL